MSTTTILRNSTVPATFKFKVESLNLNCTVYDSEKQENVTFPVEVGLVEHPQSHSIPAVDIFNVLMETSALIMSSEEFKNKSTSALVFNKSDSGEIIAACISNYDVDGECYYYNFSFDTDEIKGIKNTINFMDYKSANGIPFEKLFNYTYLKFHNMGIQDTEVVKALVICALETIFQWLDTNASESEEVTLVMDDVTEPYKICTEAEYKEKLKPIAKASVIVNKDIKKMSIEFSDELRTIAKGCSDIVQ